MKKISSLVCCLLFFAASDVQAIKNDARYPANKREEPKISINNRILTRVNGKPISTYDLMKKMDVAFFRQYPEYASSIEARAQFYEMSWKSALAEMIDKQLILADAEESKITISSGDLRQEIESAFGPNVIANLDKVGLSYDEAAKIMQDDITIQRLVNGRVHAKALRQVTPNKIRAAYEEFIKDPANEKSTQWIYKIITIQERTLPRAEEAAKSVYQMLGQNVPLEDLKSKLKDQRLLGRKGKITISKTLKHNDKEISKDYLKVLLTMDKGSISQPFSHKSRANNQTVYRIILLEDKIPGGIPSYRDMEASLKEKLMNEEVDKETDNYLQKLRLHYHLRLEDLENSLPPGYKPFVLK